MQLNKFIDKIKQIKVLIIFRIVFLIIICVALFLKFTNINIQIKNILSTKQDYSSQSVFKNYPGTNTPDVDSMKTTPSEINELMKREEQRQEEEQKKQPFPDLYNYVENAISSWQITDIKECNRYFVYRRYCKVLFVNKNKEKNPLLCKELTTRDQVDSCVMDVVHITKDKTFCNNMLDETKKIICKK